MAIQSSQFEQEYDKEDAMYTFQEAVRAIHLWKPHQLRLLNQDAARTDCIDFLDNNSVLLIQDWAMKFLPFKNWFVLKTPWIFIAKICLESTTVTSVFNVGASEASFCLIQVNAIQFKVVHETISVIKKIICCI